MRDQFYDWSRGKHVEPWYVSRRAIKMRDGTYIEVEGIDPWNTYALEPGFLGEHARWWLKLQQKYDRRWKAWKLWQIMPPPPISTMRWYKLSPIEEAGGLLLTAYAVWKTVFR
jgi:hypothetical protein